VRHCQSVASDIILSYHSFAFNYLIIEATYVSYLGMYLILICHPIIKIGKEFTLMCFHKTSIKE